MKTYTLQISEDEAIVLFEFLSQYFHDDEDLRIRNAGEYSALANLSAQIDKTTSAMFDPEFESLLRDATERLSQRVGNTWPGGPTND